ncbi:MAG: galactose-1-phosphate uridylyltransferase [Candidatus Omnitrophota bacterium]
MPELRKDPIIGRWVIIATERARRPNDFKLDQNGTANNQPCPFCEGNEKLTPPEVDADRPVDTAKDTPGWLTRTVPNKYPALTNEPEVAKQIVGVFEKCKGVGEHEVVIENPDHNKQLADLSLEEIKKVILVCKRRSIKLGQDSRFKYVLIFKNYGLAAGASLEHSHTQLISLPIVPRRVSEELECIHRYFVDKKSCLFCDVVKQEMEEKLREVGENEDFYAFCPFASRSPFEVTIVPKKHKAAFTDINQGEVDNFAQILKDILTRVKILLDDPPYNFIIHTSPLNDNGNDIYHWHAEVMPKLSKIAGFEWGTGFYINSTPPELASKYLKEVNIHKQRRKNGSKSRY